MKGREDNFLVRGSHTTMSGHSLLPSTPSDIVDRMNENFGFALRQDLVKLMPG